MQKSTPQRQRKRPLRWKLRRKLLWNGRRQLKCHCVCGQKRKNHVMWAWFDLLRRQVFQRVQLQLNYLMQHMQLPQNLLLLQILRVIQPLQEILAMVLLLGLLGLAWTGLVTFHVFPTSSSVFMLHGVAVKWMKSMNTWGPLAQVDWAHRRPTKILWNWALKAS